jgi:hypothetical protein
MASTNVRHAVSATERVLVVELFEQIATAAAHLERVIFHATLDNSDPALSVTIDSLLDGIGRIGWAADLGSEKMCGSVVKGGPEEWLLSPVFNATKLEVAHG